jgi:hypothetical protein
MHVVQEADGTNNDYSRHREPITRVHYFGANGSNQKDHAAAPDRNPGMRAALVGVIDDIVMIGNAEIQEHYTEKYQGKY